METTSYDDEALRLGGSAAHFLLFEGRNEELCQHGHRILKDGDRLFYASEASSETDLYRDGAFEIYERVFESEPILRTNWE